MNQTVQTTSIPLQLPDFQQAWEFVLGELRTEVTRSDYNTWVKPMRPLGYQENVFTLGVYNNFAKEWVEDRLKTRITQLLSGVLSGHLALNVVVMTSLFTAEEAAAPGMAPPVEAAAPIPVAVKPAENSGSRKVMLARAYGSERARLIQPERGMFVTQYFLANWLPILGHSAFMAIIAARSMCYWNPLNGDLRNTIEIEIGDLAARASVSLRTMKQVLADRTVRRYFLRYKVRRKMTPNGIRNAGIYLLVRMDDPLTPDHQHENNLPDEERWYPADFEDEREDEELD